ncbi:MAG: hypothetical protein ABEJ05_00695 [Haloglomus sp.]
MSERGPSGVVRTLRGRNRARVPFALVGVVLLVTSTAFHASLGAAPVVQEPSTEAALERAGAAAVPALRSAVRRAARKAAADPVVTPANTTVGRALNDTRPFRDALRLRIYLAAHATLDTVRVRDGSVQARATLPPIADAETTDVRRAIERVDLRRTGPNGTRIRVRLRNVSVRASRDGRVLTRETVTPTLSVATPVLALHDRTTRYERRLDIRTLSPESAGARLTLGTYLLAYGRGTAQWAGAPIANVLGNHHLALATDAAVYDAQARTFGTRDPGWVDGLRATATRTLGKDALNLGFEGAKQSRKPNEARAMDLLRQVLSSATEPATPTSRPFERDPVTVDVGQSADAALAGLHRRPARGEPNLTRVLRDAYTIDARLATHTRRIETSRDGRRRPESSGNWRLVDRKHRAERHTRPVADSVGTTSFPKAPAGWHTLSDARRRVVVRETVVRRWRDDDDRTVTTRRRTTTEYWAAIALLGQHARPNGAVPRRPVDPVHERGGALDGPNLAGTTARATEALVADRGGYDTLAKRAVAGAVNTTAVLVRGRRPPALTKWVERDLASLHRRVRNISVRSSRRDLGTLAATPAADLAAALRHRRRALLDPPQAYDGVADRARVAARAAYLDGVIARLDARAERGKRARNRLNESLVSRGIPSLSRIERLRAVSANVTARALGRGARRQGGVRLVPDATPNRLALTDVSRAEVGLRGGGTVRPLAARNLNVFTLPFDDVASAVRGSREGVPLPTAARTLHAAGIQNATGDRNETFVAARGQLRRAVVTSNEDLRARIETRLRREGIEGRGRRQTLVSAALSQWETPADRALALTNGSAARAVAEEAVDREVIPASTADRLELVLRNELRRALRRSAGHVPRRPATRTGRLARALLDAGATEASKTTAERAGAAARKRVYSGDTQAILAGLPVLPPVQPWYATVNVWHVRVRGVHPSLVVRARGRGRPGPALTYERDGQVVRLDVDGDGDSERLGRATRVTFDIETAVLVAVPPGGQGVGDVDGNADERTGWPTPSPWPGPDERGTGTRPTLRSGAEADS